MATETAHDLLNANTPTGDDA
jgi:hypothetical protein